MKLLQIAGGFSYSKVYYNYFKELKNKEVDFFVYVPRHKGRFSSELKEELSQFESYSSEIIYPYDKYLYFTKIRRMKLDLEKKVNLSEFSMTHAHSLFSDGAVALKIKKQYNIPFIVAIRDTDINQYYKKALHLRGYATKILMEASSIIFLSTSYRDKLLNNYVPNRLRETINNKSYIIPNGISEFWLNNKISENKLVLNKLTEVKTIKLIFVGQVIRRKNIESIIKAIKMLEEKKRLKINLIVVGEAKDQNYFSRLKELGDFTHIGFVDKLKLLKLYRESDIFVMPSFTETFGLVYAEAMTQGLPVIYSTGQGFDQQFKEGEAGYSVNPYDVDDVARKIGCIIENHHEISKNCVEKSTKFDWNSIAEKYIYMYQGGS